MEVCYYQLVLQKDFTLNFLTFKWMSTCNSTDRHVKTSQIHGLWWIFKLGIIQVFFYCISTASLVIGLCTHRPIQGTILHFCLVVIPRGSHCTIPQWIKYPWVRGWVNLCGQHKQSILVVLHYHSITMFVLMRFVFLSPKNICMRMLSR